MRRSPDSTSDPQGIGGRDGGRDTAITVAVAVAAAVLPLVRVGVVASPFKGVWAEDGAVFLADAAAVPLRSVVQPSAGYGHLVPRLLSWPIAQAPVSWWPELVVVASTSVTAAAAACVYRFARALQLGRPAATVAGLAPVLVAGLRTEMLLNLANLHWALIYASAWAVLAGAPKIAAAAVTCLAVGSNPLAVLVAPLLVARRAANRRILVASIALGGVYQGLVMVAAGGSVTDPAIRQSEVSVGVLRSAVHAAGVAVFTNRVPWARKWGLVAVMLAAILIALRGRHRLAQAGLAFVGTGLFVVMTFYTGHPASRYAGMWAMFLLGVLALGLPSRLAVVAIAAVLLGAAAGFPATAYRADVPHWDAAVRDAAGDCRGAATVPVGPTGWGAATLPCHVLSSG